MATSYRVLPITPGEAPSVKRVGQSSNGTGKRQWGSFLPLYPESVLLYHAPHIFDAGRVKHPSLVPAMGNVTILEEVNAFPVPHGDLESDGASIDPRPCAQRPIPNDVQLGVEISQCEKPLVARSAPLFSRTIDRRDRAAAVVSLGTLEFSAYLRRLAVPGLASNPLSKISLAGRAS